MTNQERTAKVAANTARINTMIDRNRQRHEESKRPLSRAEIAEIRSMTLGCYWPSRAFPMAAPDWDGIYLELIGLAGDARNHRDDEDECQRVLLLASRINAATN